MRTRKAFRLPEWAINAIKTVAIGYEVTETDALLRIIDQGHKWHLKNISKIKEDLNPQKTLSKHPQENDSQKQKELQYLSEIAKTKWVDD